MDFDAFRSAQTNLLPPIPIIKSLDVSFIKYRSGLYFDND
jgi:hypothetical protein